jgi:hypothetical protein
VRRDKLARGFEGLYPITVDLVTDWGIYRDLQRHRMMTQQRALITPYLGFKVYDGLEQVPGALDLVKEAVGISRELYEMMLAQFGSRVAQYAVLMGHRMRWMMGMNWRQAAFMLELRSGTQGHISYRRVAQRVYDGLGLRCPAAASLLKFVSFEDVVWARADSEARQAVKQAGLVN